MWDGENVWAIDHGHATFNYAVDLDPRRSTAYRFFGRERTFVSQKTVDQWRGITYERFDQALGTDGRPAEGVQASWERLQEIIRHNGEVTWFLHI